MSGLRRALSLLEAAWTAAASLSMYAVMIIVSIDVIQRYVINRALGWSYDLISMYLMAAIFLLALSSTLRDDHHVRVDILFRSVSPRMRHVMELVGYVLAAVVMAGILYKGSVKAWSSFQAGEVVVTSIAWPTWVGAALIPLGVGLLVLRLTLGIFSLVVALATGADTAHGVDDRTSGTEA